jgi:hypothetical protein
MNTLEEEWCDIKIIKSCKESLETVKIKHRKKYFKIWNEEITAMIEDKEKAYKNGFSGNTEDSTEYK